MSAAVWGGVLGATAGRRACCCRVPRRRAIRRPQLAIRVLPYLRDLPQLGPAPRAAPAGRRRRRWPAVFGPVLRSAADRCRAGARRRRLGTPPARARRPATGPSTTSGSSRWCGGWSPSPRPRRSACVRSVRRPERGRDVAGAAACSAFVGGVLARDNRLTSQVTPPRAPDPRRVPRRSPSCSRSPSPRARARSPRWTASYAAAAASSPRELGRVLAAIRTGEPVERGLRPARRRAPGCRSSRASPRASPSRSSAARRWPTCCTPRPPTSARPAAAS